MLAKELTEQDRRTHDQACLDSMEWLESRGLEASFLPEPDGESEYVVLVLQQIPEPSFGPSHYE